MSKAQYDPTIKELVQFISFASVSPMGKAEYFGYTLDHLIHHYVKIQTALNVALHSDLQERVMASRRKVVALGVLSDALWHRGGT